MQRMEHVRDGIRIHILVTKNFVVEKYGVLTDTYRIKNEATGKYEARIPSDHFPVKVVLKYNRK